MHARESEAPGDVQVQMENCCLLSLPVGLFNFTRSSNGGAAFVEKPDQSMSMYF